MGKSIVKFVSAFTFPLGKELSLDLSMFDGKPGDFSTYLTRFNRKKRGNKVRKESVEYERILKSVKLPQLDRIESKGFRNEATRIFAWLRERGVEQILSVDVPDCLDQPHTDEEIVKCLGDIIIETLSWKKKDLPVQTLLKAVPQVQVLHLYSSGNQAVLSHWTSPVGLCLLQKVRLFRVILNRAEGY